jgi:hypothetical protein
LLAALRPQLPAGAEIMALADKGESSIGAKRNFLLASASAPWVSFHDDDDLPSSDYCARIMSVINGPGAQAVDVVGFRLKYYEDDRLSGTAIHSYRAAQIAIPSSIPEWCHRQERIPNHLNPVRREFALAAGFPETNHGEDADYARALERLAPREEFIDAFLYHYYFRHRRNGEVCNEFPKGRQ